MEALFIQIEHMLKGILLSWIYISKDFFIVIDKILFFENSSFWNFPHFYK
jgi:hypothetical protein